MIRAQLITNGLGSLTGCTVKGHSGYAEAGHDIVCAAVSVLTAACVNSIEVICGIPTEQTVDAIADGMISFHLPDPLTPDQAHDAQVLLRSLEQGLSDVAGEYPQHLRLSIKNGGKSHD